MNPKTRAVVTSEHGMVATEHPLASATGLRVLKEGGNAVDAALAAAATTWVTLPMMCGPGGDAFLLVYEARTGQVTALGGSGIVGTRATPDYLASLGYRTLMPQDSLLSAAVPGGMDACETAMRRWGTRDWAYLFQDAIRHAEGHKLTPRAADYFGEVRLKLAKFPETAAVYLPGGSPPAAGDWLRQPAYAETLRYLARHGAEGFYRGELGARIGRAAAERGLFDEQDLAAHQTDVGQPIRVAYRGYEVLSTPPVSQGLLHLQSQAIANQFDLRSMSEADRLHVQVEANKIATADRLRWAGDPRFVSIPLPGLLSPAYAARRAAEIRQDRCLPLNVAGDPDGDTTYLCVVDRDGNAVSLIHSLSNVFGGGELVPGTGLLLNNRAGRGFTLNPESPNRLAPGRRTMHTLNCYLVLEDGMPVIVGGTPGGDGQPQWNLQVLSYLLDQGLNVQQAAAAPRWKRTPATDPVFANSPEELALEGRFDPAVVEALQAKGHPVRVIGPWAGGGAVQLIQIDRSRGRLLGGSDPRADGTALGL